MSEQLFSVLTDHNATVHRKKKHRTAGSALLEDEVINISQCGSNTFQQQVKRLNGCRLLSRVLAAGAQRQTEMELKYFI